MFFHKLSLATAAAFAVQRSAAASIYETAANEADFSTLVAAVDAAGLKDTLSGDGTFTIFAPPNSAFDKLPKDLVAKLLDPVWQPQLQDVLLYHALGAEVRSTDLSDGMPAETLNGENIIINLDPHRVNGNSNILIDAGLVDIETDNGVIHGIDTVLTPTSVSSTIIDIGVADDDFTTLVAAVQAAGLVEVLSGEGPFTLFAPTNEAFDALPAGTVDDLLKPENKDKLTEILKYHVVAANAASSGLVSGDVETLSGDSVTLDVSDTGVKVNKANVVIPDVIASNGIIHVIDTVLLPPVDEAAATEPAPATSPTVSGAMAVGTTMAAVAITVGTIIMV